MHLHRLLHLRTYDVVTAHLVIPASVILVCVNIKLHRDVLFTLLQVKLLDAVLAEDGEEHAGGVLGWHLQHIFLFHPCVTRALARSTHGLHYCDNRSC